MSSLLIKKEEEFDYDVKYELARLRAENAALRLAAKEHEREISDLKSANFQLVAINKHLLQAVNKEATSLSCKSSKVPLEKKAPSNPFTDTTATEGVAMLNGLLRKPVDMERQMGSAAWRLPPGCKFSHQCYSTPHDIKPVFVGPRGGLFYWQGNDRKRYVKSDDPHLSAYHVSDLEKFIAEDE